MASLVEGASYSTFNDPSSNPAQEYRMKHEEGKGVAGGSIGTAASDSAFNQ